MSVSGEVSGPEYTEQRESVRPSSVRLAVASFLAPIAMTVVAYIGLAVVAGHYDPAFALGISDEAVQSIVIASSGLLAGVVVGLIGRVRGWRLGVPILVAAGVGLAVYSGLFAVANDNGTLQVWAVWLGQSVGLFAATRRTGPTS